MGVPINRGGKKISDTWRWNYFKHGAEKEIWGTNQRGTFRGVFNCGTYGLSGFKFTEYEIWQGSECWNDRTCGTWKL